MSTQIDRLATGGNVDRFMVPERPILPKDAVDRFPSFAGWQASDERWRVQLQNGLRKNVEALEAKIKALETRVATLEAGG